MSSDSTDVGETVVFGEGVERDDSGSNDKWLSNGCVTNRVGIAQRAVSDKVDLARIAQCAQKFGNSGSLDPRVEKTRCL